MINEEKFIEAAEEYLNGTLSGEKRKDFENQLNSDSEFASEFEIFQLMHSGIRQSAELDFKAQLKDIHNSIDFSEESVKSELKVKPKTSNLKTIILSIITIAAIGLLAFLFFPSNKPTEEIIKENSKPPILALLERSSNTVDLKKETAELWTKNNFKAAIPGLEKLVANPKTDNSFRLALAYSYFSDNQNAKAKVIFQELIESQDFLYSDHARWYSALIALKEKQQEKAIEILEQLSLDKNSDRNADAVNLLKDLR